MVQGRGVAVMARAAGVILAAMSRPRVRFTVAGFPSASWRGLAAALAGVIPLLAVTGCGSGDQGASQGGGAQPTVAAAPGDPPAQEAPVLKAGSVFTADDVVAAGWKKSKQFDASLLPGAIEVWYGFFDRHDIEVRVYGSHEDALGPGAQAAKEAVDRPPPPSARGMITSGTGGLRYDAYVVVGNLVLLCEQDVGVCLRLAENMPGK
jgi:hypothetical protein